MIHHHLGALPYRVGVAVSGGADSMAALDFVKNSRRDVFAVFYDHGTDTSKEAWYSVLSYCSSRDIPIKKAQIEGECPSGRSLEDWWREQRYKFFHSFEDPIITAHHLDDCVETWIFSSLHGNGKIIPYANRNVVRPFRLTRKTEFQNWCRKRSIEWHEDYSNDDVRFMRNYIRKEIVPKALVVNPGLHKVIAKKIRNESAQ
jgi:tRNA(Ile)-lysidine synthase